MYLILVTLLGFVLRLILSNQSFWLDEGASLMFAKLPLAQLFENIKTDFHPPLFYAILHFWLPVGDKTEWLIRLTFILLATLTIPAIFLLCREIFGQNSRIPYVSALFLALNPLHIYYSQELRMYSLVTLLVVTSWYFLVKKKFWLSSLFNLLSLFTFYGCIFNFVSEFIYLVTTKSKNLYKTITLLFLPSLISFVMWWPVFSAQLGNGRYLETILPGWHTLSGSLTLKTLILIPIKFILGRISLDPQNVYYLAGGMLLLIFLIIISKVIISKKSTIFWIAFLTPLFLGIIISLKTPILGYWRFLYVLPFFLILLAAGIENLSKIIQYATVIWICGVFLFANVYFWTNPKFQREDWRGLVSFLSGKNSLVLLAFPYKFAPLDFYTSDAKYLPMELSDYSLNPDIKKELDTEGKNKPIFYMDYLADLTDPGRAGLKSLENFKLKQVKVYNFNNLGQLFEFQHL